MSTSQINMTADRESISPSIYTDTERGWINVKECSGHGPSASTGGSSTIPIISRGHTFGRTATGNGKIANPGPAGAISFAATALLLSLFNVQAGSVEHPEVVVSMAVFTGGLSQFMAGMWEYPRGNVFNATLFLLYGSFWMSYAAIFIPASGILARCIQGSFGIKSRSWTVLDYLGLIVTPFFLFVVVRRNLALTVMLSTIFITLVILSISQYSLAGMPILRSRFYIAKPANRLRWIWIITGDIDKNCVFVPVPVELRFRDSERSGVDLLTSTALSSSSTSSQPLSDLTILESSSQNVISMIDRVLTYVRAVLAGEAKGDAAIGRYLMDTLGASTDDLEKGGFNGRLQDTLMISYLANLVRAQAEVSSRLALVTAS